LLFLLWLVGGFYQLKNGVGEKKEEGSEEGKRVEKGKKQNMRPQCP
jgi:hypothetical protein